MTQFSTFVLEKCGPSCNQGGCKAKFHCTMYNCVIPHTLIGWEQPSVGEFGQNIDPFLPHDQNPNKSYSTLTLMLVTKRVNKRGCIGCLLWRCFDRNDVMIVQYYFICSHCRYAIFQDISRKMAWLGREQISRQQFSNHLPVTCGFSEVFIILTSL